MTKRFILAAAAALALAACAPTAPKTEAEIPAPPPALPSADDVRAAYAGMEAAVKNKDAAALAAMYAPGAIGINADMNEVIKIDAAAVQAGATEWFKSEPVITPNIAEVQVLDADTFVESGIITTDFKRNGRPTYTTQRYTHVWQKQADGGWKIATEHMSNLPKALKERLPALNAAAAPAPDSPPLGGAAPAAVPAEAAPEKK